MNNIAKYSNSDEEEDLEALRLAALQSLKKPAAHSDNVQSFVPFSGLVDQQQCGQNWPPKGFRNKRTKFFSQHQRGGKTGHFGRERCSTLISITPVEDKPKKEEKEETNYDIDEGSTSKFARYDKSDNSESDSEEEVESSGELSSNKLKRSSSLEALMEELDAEIQGKNRPKDEKEEKVKVKKIKKKKRAPENENKSPNMKAEESNNEPVVGEEHNDRLESTDNEVNTNMVDTTNKSLNVPEPIPKISPPGRMFQKKRPRSRSPKDRRGFYVRRKRNFQMTQNPPPLIPYLPPQFPSQPLPPLHQYNPMYAPPIIPHHQMQQPPFYEVSLPPLTINTEPIMTATMAPLSPRSAAFVLQNKAIIERRKRSPRRSYSRSLSRSPRRSLSPRRTPRRSLSPRSRSPRRLRKRSFSPRRKSLSPRRRSLSPKRRNVELDSKAPVRERLGIKSKADEMKDKPKEESPKKDDKPLDPVLEARKRKFETKEIKIKEGIIRLRPKEDKQKDEDVKQENTKEVKVVEEEAEVKEKIKVEKPKENIVEVAPATTTVEEKPSQTEKDSVPDEFKELERLLNDESDEISKVDDIFSDDDSASDNEGRFKIKEKQTAKPPVLSYSKLVNGKITEIKAEPLLSNRNKERSARDRNRRKIRSTTPPIKRIAKEEPREEKKKVDSTEKTNKHKVSSSFKSERRPPSMDKRFERKIEIKIKNPSKYEKNAKSKGLKIEENKVERKMNIKEESDEEDQEEDFQPEILIENESDDEYVQVNEGDLRAQLSKKRAEKLHKSPIEGVSSRLLQYALKETVLKKKSKKKSKDKELVSTDFTAIKKFVHADYLSRKLCLSIKSERIVRIYEHVKHYDLYTGVPHQMENYPSICAWASPARQKYFQRVGQRGSRGKGRTENYWSRSNQQATNRHLGHFEQ